MGDERKERRRAITRADACAPFAINEPPGLKSGKIGERYTTLQQCVHGARERRHTKERPTRRKERGKLHSSARTK